MLIFFLDLCIITTYRQKWNFIIVIFNILILYRLAWKEIKDLPIVTGPNWKFFVWIQTYKNINKAHAPAFGSYWGWSQGHEVHHRKFLEHSQRYGSCLCFGACAKKFLELERSRDRVLQLWNTSEPNNLLLIFQFWSALGPRISSLTVIFLLRSSKSHQLPTLEFCSGALKDLTLLHSLHNTWKWFKWSAPVTLLLLGRWKSSGSVLLLSALKKVTHLSSRSDSQSLVLIWVNLN